MDSPDRRPASNEVQRVRSCSPTFRSVALVTALGAATVALSAAPAASAWSGRLRAVTAHLTAAAPAVIGRDISFPQCGGPLPAERTAAFGILGANGGKTFTRNPCLVAELAWAKRLEAPPAFYANTGNPGPKRATHWPIGQTAPKVCSARDPNSLGCSYDYGWNAAWHAYTAATDAAQRLHRVDRVNARHRAANVDWWLDVETMNSWQTLDHGASALNGQRDAATIAGAVNALWAAGVQRVGIYSTSYQWTAITGSPIATRGAFRANPVWLAGFDNHNDAARGCDYRSFTGGPVLLTQYLHKDGFDANVRCT
jgi:hypothetical protein